MPSQPFSGPRSDRGPLRWSLMLVCALMALVFSPLPARAGDVAKLEPIGFSQDGRVFAFQQSGVQDGSGFPYAEIFFLDLVRDRYLEPSPIRMRLEEDGAVVADALAQARVAAAELFTRYEPERHQGHAAAERLPTDLSAPPKEARFLARPIFPPIDKPVEIRLDTFPLAIERCDGLVPTKGFRLTRLGLDPGEAAKLLHEDKTLPESRGCPTDYGIRQVRVMPNEGASFRAVAILWVESLGFEGPDVRYIALPVPMGAEGNAATDLPGLAAEETPEAPAAR